MNHVGIELIRIPSGRCRVGALHGDPDAEDNEFPAHEVEIPHAFYLGSTPITRGQYEAFAPYELRPHSAFQAEHAVNWISWEAAEAWISRLNASRPLAELCARYRLPSEAEWEYACRAGTSTRFYYGDDPGFTRLGEHAWFADNAWDAGAQHPHPVGLKRPNAFGLYDMHGNVWEWTSDGWASYGALIAHGDRVRNRETRVLRGGAFCHAARYIRASDRDHYEPSYRHYYTGFRVCMDLEP